MTMVSVETYGDINSRSEISGRGADVIAELLSEGVETVVYVPGWMVDDYALDPVAGGKTLYVASVTDYSDAAWMLSQPDGSTEFVAKSQAVVFQRASDSIQSPQQGLDQFERGESR
ncbi:hypothetical protein [Halobacterium zhouii]|uniref:hypothetical protein n=1 Tax=Halobacterium zhouii TaxID=2902624 RepID=UPI001E5C99A8|nr:hypothetical protein [Halobacterium zhouii]